MLAHKQMHLNNAQKSFSSRAEATLWRAASFAREICIYEATVKSGLSAKSYAVK